MVTHLPKLVADAEVDSVVVAVAYVGGTDLCFHRWHMTSDDAVYNFYTSIAGQPLTKDSTQRSLPHCLDYADWDVIVIQQVSSLSGSYNSIKSHLATIVRLINSCHPRALIAWQMTWAYASYYDSDDFKRYNYSREKMEDDIEQTTQQVIESGLVDIIIPSGQAIAKARQLCIDTTRHELSRDGRHLDYGAGRYVASCCAWQSVFAPALRVNLTDLPEDYIPKGFTHVTPQNCHALRILAVDAVNTTSCTTP